MWIIRYENEWYVREVEGQFEIVEDQSAATRYECKEDARDAAAKCRGKVVRLVPPGSLGCVVLLLLLLLAACATPTPFDFPPPPEGRVFELAPCTSDGQVQIRNSR